MKKHSFSLCFIAYNEEDNVGSLINSARSVMGRLASKYEIIFAVLETSTDRTIAILREFAKQDSRVKVLIQPVSERGTGMAYRMCIEKCRNELIFYSDADNQFDLNDIKRFLPYIEKYDMVVGFRNNRQSIGRRVLAGAYNLLVKAAFGVKERDVDCAFRLMRRESIKNLRFICKTGLFTTELLVKGRRSGLRIKEIGVREYPRLFGKSMWMLPLVNLPKPKVVYNILREMKELWSEIYLGRLLGRE